MGGRGEFNTAVISEKKNTCSVVATDMDGGGKEGGGGMV